MNGLTGDSMSPLMNPWSANAPKSMVGVKALANISQAPANGAHKAIIIVFRPNL